MTKDEINREVATCSKCGKAFQLKVGHIRSECEECLDLLEKDLLPIKALLEAVKDK